MLQSSIIPVSYFNMFLCFPELPNKPSHAQFCLLGDWELDQNHKENPTPDTLIWNTGIPGTGLTCHVPIVVVLKLLRFTHTHMDTAHILTVLIY